LLKSVFLPVEAASILTISSARPADPLTGVDDNHSHPYPLSSRPLGFGRNALGTQRFINLDLRVVRYIPFGGKRRLDFVVETFNLFNHPNVLERNPFYGTGAAPLASYGAPIAFAAARQLRFSIDFEF
jgi:hypothetical protein